MPSMIHIIFVVGICEGTVYLQKYKQIIFNDKFYIEMIHS